MRHDPDRDAAAYLAGQLPPLRRLWFERHLLDCRACWAEVSAARQGRLLAEGLREVAPASVRERIRAVADIGPRTAPARSGRWPYLLTVTAAALLVLAALTIPRMIAPDQPAPLAAAARLQTSGSLHLASSPAPPIPTLGSYTWRGSTQRDVGGIPATVYGYADPHGHRILILVSARPFPRAEQARTIDPAPSWLATIDGVSLLCADRNGSSWLATAPDDATALMTGDALGLN